MSATPEAVLASHAQLPPARIPQEARAAVAATLLDTLACMLAGQRSPECRALRAMQLARGGAPEASIVGVGQRVPAAAAALVNAALAHWNEWDDLHDDAIIHASAVIWPVLLATAQAANRDGPEAAAELVAAATIAFDLAAAIGSGLTPHAHSGWYATAPGGAIGAAAGAARLWGLDRDAIRSAMGLAATAAGLTRQPLLDRVNGKNALCAQTVQVAMTAVELARAGVIGTHNYLTGLYGFGALMAHGPASATYALDSLGSRFAVQSMSVKPWPCCRATHQSIDLALGLHAEDPGIGARIRSIEVRAPQPTWEMVGAPFEPGANPRVSAQFSIPYTMSLALQHGAVRLADFESQNILADEKTRAFAQRVRVVPFPLAPGEGMYDPPLGMTVQLEDGTQRELSIGKVKGSPAHPVTREDSDAKLADCAQGVLTSAQQADLRAAVAALDRNGLAPVLACLPQAAA